MALADKNIVRYQHNYLKFDNNTKYNRVSESRTRIVEAYRPPPTTTISVNQTFPRFAERLRLKMVAVFMSQLDRRKYRDGPISQIWRIRREKRIAKIENIYFD